jgi:chromosome segregation protein
MSDQQQLTATRAGTMITRIVLQGFKSFNKRISVPLLQGFNIICGPNGVGKSNILDAIAFVLGRTSAKSMRADKLHELIFSGNGNAAQYASVTLYLDNSTKIFPFEESEISITRKVNRRGVSIYKINGKTMTREKIVDILAAARIYSDGHNLVLQGDITEVIEMMPEERRTIVDEISGIADYNDKKEKATKDLEAVDAKLKEAEIVITERYDLYKKLEDERNAAIKYQQLQKQMQILKASLAYRKLSNFNENQKAMDDEITKKEVENEELQKEIEKIERELEEREKGIQQLASKLMNIAKRIEVEKEISYLRTKILIDKDKSESNKKEIERLENMIRRMSTLESRMQEMGDMPRAVKAILDLKMKGVHGTIRNLIKVPEKYQIAAEVTAAGHLNDIVIDNDVIANEAIEFLKREKIGRATFLPLNKIKAREFDAKDFLKQKGIIDVVTKVLKFDQKFASAIDFVFGSTLLVDTLSSARAIGIGKARMVTLDGDLVERSGAMIGGFYAHQPKFAKEIEKDEISEYQNLKKKLEEEIKSLHEEIQTFEEKLKEYSKSEETKEFIDLSKMKIDTEEELGKMRSQRRVAYERRLHVQTDLNRLKIQKAKVEAELENVKIEVEQYGQVEYLNQGIKTLETGIANAMKELAALGAVNFKAIEQYENFKTEFDEYKKKYEKILEEKKAVLEMINQIEQKRKEMFYQAMVELSKKFDEIFFKMTGGHASINLEDPENLESGLMIQATPAAKNLLNIDSMSGGEKSITALAFLFAVQEYRPAPFYILDEIDAALDKENSNKVATLIKNLSKEAQFIVISHNDNTIKQGDRVYGCTMEKGESKIIGLELPKE